MKEARFTTEQIIANLLEHAAGAAPAELMRVSRRPSMQGSVQNAPWN